MELATGAALCLPASPANQAQHHHQAAYPPCSRPPTPITPTPHHPHPTPSPGRRYTVEFGVIRQGAGIKAFGAGILSSFGELQHMASGAVELAPFDPFGPQPKMSYKDGYQRRYFVLDSFEEGAGRLKGYCRSMHQSLPKEVLAAVA